MKKLTTFLILCFSISYVFAAVMYLLKVPYEGITTVAIGVVYMFMPLISVLITEKVIFKSNLKDELKLSFKWSPWYFAAIGIPVVLGFLSLAIALLFKGVSFDSEMTAMIEKFSSTMTPEQIAQMKASITNTPIHPLFITTIQGIIAGITVNAVAGFGEEIGWRGFMVKELKGTHFITAAIFIGVIWGLWHAPLILQGHNYPQHPLFGVGMMTVWCTLLSFPFLYITIKANSVYAAAIMHGTLNGTAGIGFMMLKGGNDLTIGVTGAAGFFAILLVTLLLGVYDYFISKEKIMFNVLN